MQIARSLSAIIATVLIAALPLTASAQVSIGVGFTIGTPPPPLPYYTQPVAPYPNWQWQPGYWAWGPAGYYWVPGAWVGPPVVGLYWTPGYWGAGVNGAYVWNNGYWGPQVGFYGGINYGFGYYGTGFVGGFWSGPAFAYNGAIMNVNRTVVRNVYINKTVINKGRICSADCRVSFNGGSRGIHARPTAEQIAARERGRAPTSAQIEHARLAAQDRTLAASVNHDRPQVTTVQKPVSDTKALPHFQPVTSADKRTAQAQLHRGSESNATMQRPHHNSAANQPPHEHPPSSSSMHTQSSAHTQSSMHGKPPGRETHPQSGKPPQGQQPPAGQKPPQSGNGQNYPPQ
jgi:hypothetical protein